MHSSLIQGLFLLFTGFKVSNKCFLYLSSDTKKKTGIFKQKSS